MTDLPTKQWPKVIAVTIGIGEVYEHLADLAGRSCSRHTGLPVYTIGQEAVDRYKSSRPDLLKFEIFEEFATADTILYFDANAIFIREFDVLKFVNVPAIVCIKDLWDMPWVIGEARALRIKPQEYFHGGILILNRVWHKPMLEYAKKLVKKWLPAEWAGQNAINGARAEMGVPVHFLSKAYNYLRFEDTSFPEKVTIGHVNGVAKRPKEIISRYYQFWGRNSLVLGASEFDTVNCILGRYIYTRVGYDHRFLTLLPGGKIGEGAATYETTWDLSMEGQELVLWIIGMNMQPICYLVRIDDEHWSGRWMRFEQMPVELQRSS
jgi:hypothetical protein